MAWLAAAAPYIAVAGTAVSVVGQIQQGKQQEKIAEYNAAIAEQEAVAASKKAAFDADASARRFKVLMGKQRALYAKAGVDIASGSPLLLLTAQAEEAERDRQSILFGGQVASTQRTNQAGLFRLKGSQARTASRIGAGSTFLTGLGQTARALGGKFAINPVSAESAFNTGNRRRGVSSF